jgi:eukaryotic-like serine/threonine-protein kinase
MPEVWKKWEGQVVNEEFPLLRYLGGSERSAVFLTKRTDREPQEVAIKLILANAENPELQVSWWELAAKLSHPHLLRLFQTGHCEIEGTQLIYVVTEYAEESLSQILPYRTLTPEEARDTLRPVLDVLAYIHAKGFVHGHIKPANVMAVGDLIKVSSDGLCGVGESSRVLGATNGYAAPEIADGAGMAPAADVWSLGVTLVEALTQNPPVWKGTEQTELVLPETLPFSDIATHCLRRNPQQRWTVPEIAERLNQAPLAPQEKEIVEPKSSFTKWSYLVPAIAAGLVLLVVLGYRALHHHPSGEQAASQQNAEIGQSGQNTPGENSINKEQASSAPASANAPPVAAKNSAGARSQGTVAHQAMPDVSNSALRSVHGKLKIRIKVTVDSFGNVVLAKFDSRGPSKYFAERTLEAARQWKFNPPQVDGRGVPSEWILKFEFTRSGATVHPAQTFP